MAHDPDLIVAAPAGPPGGAGRRCSVVVCSAEPEGAEREREKVGYDVVHVAWCSGVTRRRG